MMDWIAHHAGIIGLLFFVGFFTLTVLWVFRPGSSKHYAKTAQIPLKEDDDE
ncbi:MAG: cbb3-type cytochrome c oxidase subunit 3 [Rhodospirillales bacterium]|nr:cbb3-type cytochrome c oxidase subunit 3 [Alphaproteobacteria bacterium]USO03796.1 MAG: cbb3-type cytochrome c oxidase subunit 3 [Rhodospirillales bacterium]